MSSYDSLQSPSKLFSHNKPGGNAASTAAKRSLPREYAFKSPERRGLNFDIVNYPSELAGTVGTGMGIGTGMATGLGLKSSANFDHGVNSVLATEAKLLDKGRKVAELEAKIELVLRSNRELVDENHEMKGMLLAQRSEIDSLRARRSRAMDLALTEELESKNYEHRVEVEKLLAEITRLQEEFLLAESAKNLEILAVRDQLERTHLLTADHLMRSRAGVSEAYEEQIRRMGEVIQFKEEDIEKLLFVHRREKDALLEEVSALKSELRHVVALKANEISELKFGY